MSFGYFVRSLINECYWVFYKERMSRTRCGYRLYLTRTCTSMERVVRAAEQGLGKRRPSDGVIFCATY
jgi:hypothetical protein